MVMDFMKHDLKVLLRKMKHPFSTSEIKCLMKQLLEGVAYMHKNWYVFFVDKVKNIFHI